MHVAAEPLGTGVHVSVKPKRAEGLGATGGPRGSPPGPWRCSKRLRGGDTPPLACR